MAKTELYLIDLFNDRKVSIDKVNTREKDITECIEMVFYNRNNNNEIEYSFYLDKSTAIKFAKTLRTEINKIQEVGNV